MTKSACRCVYQTLPTISVSIISFLWIRRYTPKSFSTSADFFNACHTPPATGVFVVNNFLIWYAKNRQEIEQFANFKIGRAVEGLAYGHKERKSWLRFLGAKVFYLKT